MVEVCLGFLVDTVFCVQWLAKLNIFIILILVSEFIVVVLLSKWWLFYLSAWWSGLTTADHCGYISGS